MGAFVQNVRRTTGLILALKLLGRRTADWVTRQGIRPQVVPHFVCGCLIAYYYHAHLYVYLLVFLLTLAFNYAMKKFETGKKKDEKRRRMNPSLERLLFLVVASIFIKSLTAVGLGRIERRVSVVIPSRYEAAYVVKTVMYVFDTTPMSILHEVILVDDQSEVPIEGLINKGLESGGELAHLSTTQRKAIKIIRNEAEHQGLIRAKIQGGNFATGDYIFFLDAHCRPRKKYMEEMLTVIEKGTYKRIVCPTVGVTDPKTWENSKTGGVKMMFEWDFNFHWYDDGNDEVPIMSGGLLLMTKKYWSEGGLDEGMDDWGGENIEQSVRTWLCGGDIVVARNSYVGHIFDRPAVEHKVKPGGVKRNNARAAFTWLDDYVIANSKAGGMDISEINSVGSLERQMLKRMQDQCRPFNYFMQLFRTTFDQRGLFVHNMHHLRDTASGLCLTGEGDKAHKKDAKPEGTVLLKECRPDDTHQRWSAVADDHRILNQYTGKCLDAGNRKFDGSQLPILYSCTFGKKDTNVNQSWKFIGSSLSPLRRSNTIHFDHMRDQRAVGYLAQVPSRALVHGLRPLKPADSQHVDESGCIGKNGNLVDCSQRSYFMWIW